MMFKEDINKDCYITQNLFISTVNVSRMEWTPHLVLNRTQSVLFILQL